MSNAIIKQQGDSPVVADNIWDIQLGAGSFILGALTGALVTAAAARLAAARPEPVRPMGGLKDPREYARPPAFAR